MRCPNRAEMRPPNWAAFPACTSLPKRPKNLWSFVPPNRHTEWGALVGVSIVIELCARQNGQNFLPARVHQNARKFHESFVPPNRYTEWGPLVGVSISPNCVALHVRTGCHAKNGQHFLPTRARELILTISRKFCASKRLRKHKQLRPMHSSKWGMGGADFFNRRLHRPHPSPTVGSSMCE